MVFSLIQLLLLSLLLLCLLRGKAHWQRWARHGFRLIVAATFLFMTPNVLHRTISAWENGDWDDTHCGRPIDTIVVLPGGTNELAQGDVGWHHLTLASVHRLQAGINLLKTSDTSRLLIPGNQREGKIMDQLVIRSGVSPERIVTGSQSSNTWLAAAWIAQTSDGSELGNIGLVTSALHMRRSLWSFQQHRIEVCPLAVDFVGLRPRPHWLLPKPSDIGKADRLLHEVTGMFWYWFRYRTSAA